MSNEILLSFALTVLAANAQVTGRDQDLKAARAEYYSIRD
jgi:hypothetical protein